MKAPRSPDLTRLLGSLSLLVLCACDGAAASLSVPNLRQDGEPPAPLLPTCAAVSGSWDACFPMETVNRAGIKYCYAAGGGAPQWLDGVTGTMSCGADSYQAASFRCCAPPPAPEPGCLMLTPSSTSPQPVGACHPREQWDDTMMQDCQRAGKKTAQIHYGMGCGGETYRVAYAYCCD